MKLGVVGLPNVGKSTLFNAITHAGAECANYPFCTIEPNVGVVAVPDERLNVLGKMYNTKKITPAVVEFVDIAGLVKGASKGEGLGNKFLANIRECDAVVHVVRCFEDENVTHVESSVDPLRDIETIDLELIFADIESVEKRYEKAVSLTKTGDKKYKIEAERLEKLKKHLESGKPARTVPTENDEEKEYFDSLFLLTNKPVIYAANIGEADMGRDVNEIPPREKSKGIRRKRRQRIHRYLRADGRGTFHPRSGRTGAVFKRTRAARKRAEPPDPRLLPPSGAHFLPHRRRKGSARVDRKRGHESAAGGGQDPFRFRKGIYPRGDRRLRHPRGTRQFQRLQGKGKSALRGQRLRHQGRGRGALPLQRVIKNAVFKNAAFTRRARSFSRTGAVFNKTTSKTRKIPRFFILPDRLCGCFRRA